MPSSNICCPITVDIIYEKVKVLLINCLGKYIFTNGKEYPSICIGQPPIDIKTYGLEVIIDLLPQVNFTELTTTSKIEKQKWKITLIDRDNGRSLPFALSQLQKLSTNNRYIYFPTSKTYENPILVFEFFIHQSVTN